MISSSLSLAVSVSISVDFTLWRTYADDPHSLEITIGREGPHDSTTKGEVRVRAMMRISKTCVASSCVMLYQIILSDTTPFILPGERLLSKISWKWNDGRAPGWSICTNRSLRRRGIEQSSGAKKMYSGALYIWAIRGVQSDSRALRLCTFMVRIIILDNWHCLRKRRGRSGKCCTAHYSLKITLPQWVLGSLFIKQSYIISFLTSTYWIDKDT